MTNVEIANTIISQFGKSFPLLVGMKNPVAIEQGVQFNISKAKQGINKVVITLNGRDTYDLNFWRITTKATKEITAAGDIYNDQLGDVFENITGLYTHF